MRTTTLTRWLLSPGALLTVAAATWLAGPAALAQQADDRDGSFRGAMADAAGLFSLSFEGGDAATFIRAVRRAHGRANIIAAPNISQFRVPPVELTDVTLRAAMGLLARAEDVEVDGRRLDLDVDMVHPDGAGEPVFTVRTRLAGPATSALRESAVRSVSELVAAGWSTDNILAALQTAMSVEPGEAEIKFHEATNLVILRGSEDQLAVAFDALSELKTNAERRNDALEFRQRQVEDIEMELAQAEGDAQLARSRLTLRIRRLELGQASAASPEASEEDQGVLALNLAAAQHDVEEARVELEIAQKRTQMLRERLKRAQEQLSEAQSAQ